MDYIISKKKHKEQLKDLRKQKDDNLEEKVLIKIMEAEKKSGAILDYEDLPSSNFRKDNQGQREIKYPRKPKESFITKEWNLDFKLKQKLMEEDRPSTGEMEYWNT